MKSATETPNKRLVYVSVSYESLRNIANLQTVSIPKDMMKCLPEERITFLQLPQDKLLISDNNNDCNSIEEQPPSSQDVPIEIDLPPDGIVVKPRNPRKMQCNVCNQTFTNVEQYEAHVAFHRNVKKYKCEHCFESYNVEDNFKLHMALHTSATPVCPLCNKTFQRFAGFKSHLLLHLVDETFTCKECLAEFEKETDYFKHLEKHTVGDKTKKEEEKMPYVCSYCNYVFEDVGKYKEHISHHVKIKKLVFNSKKTRQKTTDNKDNPHKCSTCGKSFRKACLLERHLRIHSGERPYSCTKCDKRFTQKGSLQIHLLKHTGFKPHKCTLCSASFFQKCNLKVHIEKAHTAPKDSPRVYKCSQCTCVFKKIASLNTHVTKNHTGVEQPTSEFVDLADQLKALQQMAGPQGSSVLTESYVKLSEAEGNGTVRSYLVKQKTMDGTKIFLCTYCPKEFKKPSDLIRHLRVHTREKPYECNICEATFSLKSVLRAHMNTHLGKKEHQCLVCLQLFSSTKRLNKHLRTHDNSEDALTLKYKCSSCDKLFNTAQSIKQHMEIHQCLNSENIEGTQKSFSIDTDLKQPILNNPAGLIELPPPKFLAPYVQDDQSKDRPFKCHLCPGAFTKSDHLRTHMTSHDTEKTYKCDICEKTFSTVSNLNQHKLSHGPRKHECHICFKRFSKASYLQAHQKQHIDVGNYVCPYCKKEFKNAQWCRKHIRTHKGSSEDAIETLNEGETGYNLLDLKNNSVLVAELEGTDNQGNKEVLSDDLVSNCINQGLSDDINKDVSYSLSYPENDNMENIQISSAVIEGNQNLSTIFISCNDLQQIDTGIFDSELPPEQIQTGVPILEEPQDVNLLFMDPLGQQVDLQEVPPTLETFNQVMLNETVVPTEINLNLEMDRSLPNPEENITDLPTLDQAGFKIKLIGPKELVDHNKLASKQTSKLILPIENTEVGKENLYITISLDDLKMNNLGYLSNVIGLTDIDSTTEDLQLVETDEMLVSESRVAQQVSCAVCKVFCDSLEDLASHRCIDILEKNQAEDNQMIIDVDEEAIESQQNLSLENGIDGELIIGGNSGGIGEEILSEEALQAGVVEKKSSNVCQFCAKEFKKLSDLRRHIRTHTGERPFKCEKCTKSFTLKSTLLSHMRTHDPNENKLICNICNYSYSCKSSLKVHRMIHYGIKPFQCHLCPAKFRTAAHRKMHVSKHSHLNQMKKKGTVKSDIKNVLTYTNNYFEAMLTDQRSEEIQLDQPPDDVDIDAQEVADSNPIDPSESLAMSDSLHIDFLQQLQQLDQQLVFDIDDIQDKNANQTLIIENLPNSIEINMETAPVPTAPVKEKKFECDICGKMYSTKSILRKHQKNHKKYVCSKCNKQYDVEDDLEKHMKIHMGYRPFSCLHCANSFSEESSLKTHMKRIHNLAS